MVLWFKIYHNEDKNGNIKMVKIPISPIICESNEWNKKENWTDFETALDGLERSGCDGLSFVLTEDSFNKVFLYDSTLSLVVFPFYLFCVCYKVTGAQEVSDTSDGRTAKRHLDVLLVLEPTTKKRVVRRPPAHTYNYYPKGIT